MWPRAKTTYTSKSSGLQKAVARRPSRNVECYYWIWLCTQLCRSDTNNVQLSGFNGEKLTYATIFRSVRQLKRDQHLDLFSGGLTGKPLNNSSTMWNFYWSFDGNGIVDDHNKINLIPLRFRKRINVDVSLLHGSFVLHVCVERCLIFRRGEEGSKNHRMKLDGFRCNYHSQANSGNICAEFWLRSIIDWTAWSQSIADNLLFVSKILPFRTTVHTLAMKKGTNVLRWVCSRNQPKKKTFGFHVFHHLSE